MSGDVATAIRVFTNLAERVVEERERRGMSYRDLARETNLAPSAVYYFESGQRQPSYWVTLRMLRWLDPDG